MRVEPRVPRAALDAMLAPLAASGAARTDAPFLLPLNLLLDLSGEALRARLFVVQAEGGAEMCLRPDFTVAIAADHVAAGRASGRYLYEGPAFRSAAGADRPEEFLQIGMEHLGGDGGEAGDGDLEILALAWRASAAGGRSDLSIRLGDVALFSAFIDALGLAAPLAARLKRVAARPRLLQAELARAGETETPGRGALAARLSGLSPKDAAALMEEIWTLAGVEPVGGRGPAEIAERLAAKSDAGAAPALTAQEAEAIRAFLAVDDRPDAALAALAALGGAALEPALAAWRERIAALTQDIPSDRMRFSPALGHAFDYYDGVVFEVISAALGPDRAVAVGGRYDGLLNRLGAASGARRAVGCMVRPWRAWAEGEA